jgi:adenosylmethionine-8-amino-7-oxononanoate aminotransferase
MSDFLILGTDTDAGKTTFALLWLAAFADWFEYWKPIETGASDSDRVAALVPDAFVHPVFRRFQEPVAPPLAASLQKQTVPPAAEIVQAKPRPSRPGRSLVIESFGSPLSPLTEEELQIELIARFGCPAVLVSSSAVGAIGRTLQCLYALTGFNLVPAAVVLFGQPDEYARTKLTDLQASPVFLLRTPKEWTTHAVREAAAAQREILESIRAALAEAHNLKEDRPASSPLLARDAQSVWHPYTSLRDPDPPLACVGVQDEFLHLADGRRVIDGISSWWTILHGHRDPRLLAALREAASHWDHVHFAGVTHQPAIKLAELLLTTAPWRGGRVFFSDNGSTAVEVALKMAYQFWCHHGEPQRTRFVGFEGGYHGDTFGAMAVSRDPVFFGRFEPLLFRADILPLSPQRLDDTLTERKGEVAAVMVEPLVQGAGGMRMHSPALLRQLAEVTRQHGVLFIADEVMTGGGRTGTLWAHQAAAITPDLICAAKTLAGGVLPLAATLVAPQIVAAWDTDDRSRTFFHGHSFTAHPLACAVAVANWKLLTAKPPSAPARFDAFWREALAPLRQHAKVRDLRVCGTIAALEIETPGGYLANAARTLRRVCLENGVLLRPLGSVLYAMPPYCTSDASLEQIATAMKRAVQCITV